MVVELHPLAALSGRAEVGIISRRFLDGNAPTFTGRVVRTDLEYRLLGRTRFDLGLQRDLQYSFQSDRRDYLQAGIEVSVTHRLADAWEVRGSLARYALTYVLETPSGTGFATEEETVRRYAVDVGRYVAGVRVGLQVSQQARTQSANRDYERTRIVSSVTYGF